MLAAVVRAAHSGGQTTSYPTPLHSKASILKPLFANINAALQHVQGAAEQLKAADRWTVMRRYISDKIAPKPGPFRPPTGLPAKGVTAGFRLNRRECRLPMCARRCGASNVGLRKGSNDRLGATISRPRMSVQGRLPPFALS